MGQVILVAVLVVYWASRWNCAWESTEYGLEEEQIPSQIARLLMTVQEKQVDELVVVVDVTGHCLAAIYGLLAATGGHFGSRPGEC